MDNPLTLQEAKDQVAKNTVYKNWQNIYDEMYGTSEYIEYLEKAAGLLEAAKRNVKPCPNCLSEDVIMFTADLDICNRCHQTF